MKRGRARILVFRLLPISWMLCILFHIIFSSLTSKFKMNALFSLCRVSKHDGKKVSCLPCAAAGTIEGEKNNLYNFCFTSFEQSKRTTVCWKHNIGESEEHHRAGTACNKFNRICVGLNLNQCHIFIVVFEA